VTQSRITDEELKLLIEFKLEGGYSNSPAGTAALSNAARQKMKRLLAKLRRLATRPL